MEGGTEEEIRYWPRGLQNLARVIGSIATLQLAKHYGGLDKLHVPVKANLHHPWAQIIGFENLDKLSKAYGGERISIPRGAFKDLKKVQIMDLAEKGHSSKDIAREIGCTERWVQMVRREDPPDENQPTFI